MKKANTFATESEYKNARMMLDEYNKHSLEYCRANKTNGIPAEVYTKFPFADKVNNEMRSKIEVWEFIHEKPEKYFIYISEEKRAGTTWMGDFLGDLGKGREYKSIFGDTRVSINIYGINGVNYYGTYYKSAGDYAIIKAFKKK